MGRFIGWWLLNTISLFFVAALLPGVDVEGGLLSVVLIALLIGLINALLRPILYFASCGLIILTLGLIIPVLNALLLLLADEIAGSRFEIDGLGWAILAAILMGLLNGFVSSFVKDDKDKEKPHVIRSR